MIINAQNLDFKELNEIIRKIDDKEIEINNCIGQRYIASGLCGKNIVINGTAGNSLGAYLDGCNITVNGNAQDATGDTMDSGNIFINGSSGDATGYAMRGGKIFVKNNIGYRAGIHMKQYKQKKPILIIGGKAGSFLGEYQAGGIIIVLGLDCNGDIPVGRFCGTGMHGGKIYLRCDKLPFDLPEQVSTHVASDEDKQEIYDVLNEFCNVFNKNIESIIKSNFFVLTPNSKNPYRQLYIHV